jgi:transposase-like protein
MSGAHSTVSVPESVALMKHTLARLQRHPALSPLRIAPMVELPCCGIMVDFEGIECSQDGPSRVFWPPRWTCPECDETFTLNHDESALADLGSPEAESST